MFPAPALPGTTANDAFSWVPRHQVGCSAAPADADAHTAAARPVNAASRFTGRTVPRAGTVCEGRASDCGRPRVEVRAGDALARERPDANDLALVARRKLDDVAGRRRGARPFDEAVPVARGNHQHVPVLGQR